MIRLSKRLVQSVLDILFPAFCISCQEILPSKRYIVCNSCYGELNRVKGDHIELFLKRLDKIYFEDLFIIFDYSDMLQKLMHFFKYEGFLVMADYFSNSVVKNINNITNTYDMITCVPLHKTKQKERGFNQSEVLSKKINTLCGLSYAPILKRIRYTKSQTKLSRKERKKNMMNAFSIQTGVSDKSILLIDDVITTGATLNECARVLKEAGAKKVDVCAIATPVDILKNNKETFDL